MSSKENDKLLDPNVPTPASSRPLVSPHVQSNTSPATSSLPESSVDASKESYIYADKLAKAPVAFENELCCTVGHGPEERDYFLLEHVRSGHYNPCYTSIAAREDSEIDLPPIRQESNFTKRHCLIPATFTEPLRSPGHIRLIALHPKSAHEDSTEDPRKSEHVHLGCDVYQVALEELKTGGEPLYAAVS